MFDANYATKKLLKVKEESLKCAISRAKALIESKINESIDVHKRYWCDVDLYGLYKGCFSNWSYNNDKEMVDRFANEINSWLKEKGFKTYWHLHNNIIVHVEWAKGENNGA